MFHLSYTLFTIYVLRSSLLSLLSFFNDPGLVYLVSLMIQVAWQPWKLNITCKRLDHRRVKLIGKYPSRCSLVVGGSGWVVDPSILGSSPLGEFPWITWYTILVGRAMYPLKNCYKKKKKKKANWWAIFNQGQRIVSKTMTFYYVTVGCINRFLHYAASVFSCNFSWLFGFDNL